MAEGEADVRLYCRMAKIGYMQGKQVYTHRRMSLPIPSRLQTSFEALLNKPLRNQNREQRRGSCDSFTPRETVFARKISPREIAPKYRATRPSAMVKLKICLYICAQKRFFYRAFLPAKTILPRFLDTQTC